MLVRAPCENQRLSAIPAPRGRSYAVILCFMFIGCLYMHLLIVSCLLCFVVCLRLDTGKCLDLICVYLRNVHM